MTVSPRHRRRLPVGGGGREREKFIDNQIDDRDQRLHVGIGDGYTLRDESTTHRGQCGQTGPPPAGPGRQRGRKQKV